MTDALTDDGARVHAACEAHLIACMEAEYAADETDHDGDVESPAIAPYCGCTTCDVREVLHIAWPMIEQIVRARTLDETAQP